MSSNGKHKWNPFHHRPFSSRREQPKQQLDGHQQQKQQPPKEFLCPVSASLMSDPVVVSSGHTFERVSVEVCLNLNFTPDLEEGSRPDFSNLIPNLNMKAAIQSWCDKFGHPHPRPPDYSSVERIVRVQMMPIDPEIRVSEMELLEAVADRPPVVVHHADSEVMGRRPQFHSYSSSDESVIVAPQSPFTPLPFATRPACFTSSPSQSPSSSSSEIVAEAESHILTQMNVVSSSSASSGSSSSSAATSPEEEEIYNKFRSPDIFDHEQALIIMRRMTRTKAEARVSLCTQRILSFLRNHIVSRYSLVQNNALASLVNLSLEKPNKVTIVRSGFVPILIDILKSGSTEAQEHAAGGIFSLALEDENKMVIGVLGALPPLLYALRSAASDRTLHDAALALYHLSLNSSNRSKLVRLGAVPTLLSMVRSGDSASRVLLVICNIAASGEGRAAMLDANAVEILVGKLREEERREDRSEAATENCVAALFALSHGNMRFKGLAREARAAEVLKEVEMRGTERAREKAKKILQVMRERDPDEDDGDGGDESFDWDGVIDANGLTRSRFRFGRNGYSPNSTSTL